MNPMTLLGEKLLREELERLIRNDRPRVITAIAKAREHGDLRENAEYHAAREEQGMLESRIRTIESRLASVRVIDITSLQPTGKVIFGTTVTLIVKDTPPADKKPAKKTSDKKVVYKIVGEDEADIENNKLSYNSPLAKALMGKPLGEEIVLTNPSGKTISYLIKKIEHKA